MDKRQLLARIRRTELHAIDTDLCGITELFAERLAYISDRLDDGEISHFVDIAAAVYYMGIEELESRKAWSAGFGGSLPGARLPASPDERRARNTDCRHDQSSVRESAGQHEPGVEYALEECVAVSWR